MTAKTVRITSVRRTTATGESDDLVLKPGVNVIVGVKDTGKSGWLQTISYLLGDTDPPEKSLGAGVETKFASATLRMAVGNEEVTLERRWKEAGAKGKVFVDGAGVRTDDFSEFIFKKLDVPLVHFPKGSPFSGATWPKLSWRMLFRHVYREERFWSDLADKQPEKEQHACLLQFLGAADKVYPKELGEEIDQRKELLKLQARKEQFEDVLQQAARDLIPDAAVSAAPTLDAIGAAEERIRGEIAGHRTRRDAILADLIAGRAASGGGPADAELGDRRQRLADSRQAELARLHEVERRLAELTAYRDQVTAELNRMKRAATAGEAFKALRVTRCPCCDQAVAPGSTPADRCYVCRQPLPHDETGGDAAAKKRVEFEVEQLEGEAAELVDLLQKVDRERVALTERVRRLNEEVAEVEVLLRPLRAAVAAALPPDVSILDTQVGQLEERIAQLQRLRRAVGHRDDLSKQIDELTTKVQGLSGGVDAKSAAVPFEQLSDAMSDGINEYLGILNDEDPDRWQHQAVRFEVNDRGFKIRVGKSPLSSLGATSVCYVLLGYHYALLKLSGRDGYNYPGLALIDFPVTLADKTTIGDKENFLIVPFVRLSMTNHQFQLVVCGRAFHGLEGVHRIELKRVWKQGEIEPPVPDEARDRGDEGG